MNEEEIIDFKEEEAPEMGLQNALKWWEKKRLLFNVIVGCFGLFAILFPNGFDFDLIVIIGSLMWGFVANALYTAGFLLESFAIHYMKSNEGLKKLRWLFFTLGTMAYSTVSLTFGMAFMAGYAPF